jgi:hypothetical protein
MTSFIFILLANIWIWKLLVSNIFLGIAIIITSWLLYRALKFNSSSVLLFIFLGIVLLFQWKMGPTYSLTELNNDQIRVKDMRLREYPPIYFKIDAKTIWVPVAHWLEERKESIVLSRLTDNFFSTLDINQYFFAGHPRERVEMTEFEKYPYILLPFFILGIFILLKKKSKVFITFLVLPIILITFISNQSMLGPFCLFPAITVAIAMGLENAYGLIPKKYQRKALIFFVSLFILIFIQSISYAIS